MKDNLFADKNILGRIRYFTNNHAKYYLDLTTVLIQKEMKIKYKSSFLGYFWSIGNPLATALVFYIAFKVIMRVSIENYTLFLISGLFPWIWFANSVNSSSVVFLANQTLIKKLNFQRNLIPLVTVLVEGIHFVLSIPVIVLFLFFYHKSSSPIWFYGIPILLIIQSSMAYGVALIVSSTNLFLRDIEKLVLIITNLIFYLTPIIYHESMIPENARKFIYLNPLTPIMISWRDLFLTGTMSPISVITSLVYAIIALMIGLYVYRRLCWRFAEIL